MRKIYLVVLMMVIPTLMQADLVPVNGLTIEANGMREGDKLTRIDIPFDNNKTSEMLSVWDFSAVKVAGKEIETYYNELDSITVVENENRENRMYKIDSMSIHMIRHFRGGMDIKYIIPETVKYPIMCGSSKFGKTFGEGKLGSKSYIKNAGYASVSANMVGDLITPDGDSIANVLRLRYHRSGTTHIDEDFSRSFGNSLDSTLFSNDSICHWLATDSVIHTIDKWQWYARGYRYPIIEMRKYKTYYYGITSDSILVAYYYPLSRQETEIENDSINEYYRENGTEGYKLPKSATFSYKSNGNNAQNGANDDIGNSITSSQFICDVYPTITTNDVTIRLYTEQKHNAVCYLVSSSGVLLWTKEISMDNGYNELKCPVRQLQYGIYFVVCSDGSCTISTKVIKAK